MSRHHAPEALEYKAWPAVEAELLSKSKKLRFHRIKQAIEAACEGMKAAEILRKYGVKRGQVCYLLGRCTKVHPDGRLWGYRALIKGCRQEPYQRTAPPVQEEGVDGAGLAGAFEQLLKNHPQLRKMIHQAVRPRSGAKVKEAGLNLKNLHEKFIALLRKEGVPAATYPFNTRNNGYTALTRYVKALENTGDPGVAKNRYGSSALDGLQSGTGKKGVWRPLRPLEMAAYDEQLLPFIGTIVIEVDGKEIDIPISRSYLCLMVDMKDRAILGYSIALYGRIRSQDFLKTFDTYLKPWRPKELTVPGMRYKKGAGLPSGVVPQVYGRRIGMICVDNHLTHLAEAVVGHLRRRTGAILSYGKVRHWITRSAVEGVFAALQKRGFSLIPSTTGSGPRDPAVDDPVGKAVKFRIRYEQMMELLDVLIANQNAQPLNSLFQKTPNEDLAAEFDKSRRLDVVPRYSEKFLIDPQVDVEIECPTVCGSRKSGRSPYIQLDGAHYTNDVLRQNWSMIGQKLTVHIAGDFRKVRAFLADGSEYGVLEVTGFWSNDFHTREMRKHINSLYRERVLEPDTDRPVSSYMEYLARETVRVDRKNKEKITREGSRLGGALHSAPEPRYRYTTQDAQEDKPADTRLKSRGRRDFFSRPS